MRAKKYPLRIAETREERESIFRLRYDVYVNEMNIFANHADHQCRLLYDSQDDYSKHLYFNDGDEVIGSLRLQTGYLNSFSQQDIKYLQLQLPLESYGPQKICIVSRFIFDLKFRRGLLPGLLVQESFIWGLKNTEIAFVFCMALPETFKIYSMLGFKQYVEALYIHRRGLRVPMFLCVRDLNYLKKVRSPIYKMINGMNLSNSEKYLTGNTEISMSSINSRFNV